MDAIVPFDHDRRYIFELPDIRTCGGKPKGPGKRKAKMLVLGVPA